MLSFILNFNENKCRKLRNVDFLIGQGTNIKIHEQNVIKFAHKTFAKLVHEQLFSQKEFDPLK